MESDDEMEPNDAAQASSSNRGRTQEDKSTEDAQELKILKEI